MNVLDDYLVDPKLSLLDKTRQTGLSAATPGSMRSPPTERRRPRRRPAASNAEHDHSTG